MVRLRNRFTCPVNGFQFVDAMISPEPLKTWDFNQLVSQVIARRTQNPRFKLPLEVNVVTLEVDQQNAMRMMSIPNAESYYMSDGPAPPNFQPPPARSWRSAAGAVKTAASVLFDWLGDGGQAVAKEQAESRAGVCAKCPLNGKGDWLARFTVPAQEMIQSQIALRTGLNLSTSHDAELGVCEACACPLKLKVHVPLPHITAKLGNEVKEKLDKGCWILLETASTT